MLTTGRHLLRWRSAPPIRRPGRPLSCAAATPPSDMEAPPFSGVQELEAWLAAHGVPTAEYGVGTAKSVADLFEEVQKGESVLQLVEGAPTRAVSVLSLLITNDAGQVLTEARQRLPDGRERARGLPLSEKMLPGEGWRQAAARAVAEELGSALPPGWRTQFELREGSHATSLRRLASPSYPRPRDGLHDAHRRGGAALPAGAAVPDGGAGGARRRRAGDVVGVAGGGKSLTDAAAACGYAAGCSAVAAAGRTTAAGFAELDGDTAGRRKHVAGRVAILQQWMSGGPIGRAAWIAWGRGALAPISRRMDPISPWSLPQRASLSPACCYQ
ncbi:MAG: hypothetical protein J3K34DRAFT_260047 [Monoraphidium minutum]|nr:MAG: hypothetical protein J3K34DRAFT_260047 [Monoraphidium minutum]